MKPRNRVLTATSAPEHEESEFKIGSLVGVYILGQRWGRITELDIDDAGDLVARLNLPSIRRGGKVWHKIKDLTLEQEKQIVPTANGDQEV